MFTLNLCKDISCMIFCLIFFKKNIFQLLRAGKIMVMEIRSSSLRSSDKIVVSGVFNLKEIILLQRDIKRLRILPFFV